MAQTNNVGVTIPSTYFGFTRFSTTSNPVLPYSITRTWDSFHVSWNNIEYAKDTYNWSTMDALVNANAGKDILYTFGNTPGWAASDPTEGTPYGYTSSCSLPTNVSDWDTFVTSIATRYGENIKYWELRNEPMNYQYWCVSTANHPFSDYASAMAQTVLLDEEARRIIKSIIPDAVIVSPSTDKTFGQTWMQNYFNAITTYRSANAGSPFPFDVLAIHGYPDNAPEGIVAMLSQYASLMSSNSLSGYPVWDDEEATNSVPNDGGAFQAKLQILQWSSGVTRSIWYAYDNDGTYLANSSGLTEQGVAYQQIYNWMVGAALTAQCSIDGSGTYTCTLSRPNGYLGRIMWNSSSTVSYTPPTGYTEYRDLTGATTPISGPVSIGTKPLLLDNLAQTPVTATFDDTTVINPAAQVQGGSLPCIGAYGSCQILKDLIGALNPGFEGMQIIDTWTLPTAGTGTTLHSPVSYTTQLFYVPPGGSAIINTRWVDNPGTGHRVYDVLTSSIANPSSVGCTDNPTSVSLSSGDNAENSMTFTFAAGNCPSPKQGDTHTVYTTEIPATGTAAGSGSVFAVGGATVTYNSTTPLYGATSLEMNTTPSGSGAAYNFYFDQAVMDRFINLSGTYNVTFKAKLVSGTANAIVSMARDQSLTSSPAKPCVFTGGDSNGAVTVPLTTTATTYNLTCVATETSATVPGLVTLNIANYNQGDFLLDEVHVTKQGGDSTNTTVLRDEVIDGLRTQWYLGKRGPLRYGPLLQNCMTYANWIKADGLRLNCTVLPAGQISDVNVNLSLGDWLHVNEVLGTNAYWHLPATVTTPDALKMYQFDYATTNADRAAFGHSAPYGGPTGSIVDQDIAFGNEEWNNGNIGQGSHFAYPGGDTYSVYLNQDMLINAAIYADPSFQAANTNLLANFQYQDTQTFMTGLNKMHLGNGAPSGAELSPYYGFTNSTNTTDEGFFRAGLSQAYMQSHTAGSAFASAVTYLRSSNTWGPSGTAAPKLYVYEMANGDDNPCSSSGDHVGYPACQSASNALLDASNLQIMNVGAVNGVVAADEFIELEKSGFSGLNLFSINSFGGPSQRSNPATSGTVFYQYQYGAMVDFGGATAALDGTYMRLRPQGLGSQVAHYAVMPTMTSCATTSPTYSQPAGPSPIYGEAATIGIPYLTCARYSDGANNHGVTFVNKSTTTTYLVTLAGSALPTGTVTGLQFAPSSLRAINEAAATLPTGNGRTQLAARTDQTAASLFNSTVAATAPTTISVAPGSVVSFAYSTNGTPVVVQYAIF